MNIKLLKIKGKLLKNNKEKSRGRSMVEMLGVLAIIGVLSIGGISGYTIAMRRYKANEILELGNKYASVIWTQINNNDSCSFIVWEDGDGEVDCNNITRLSFSDSGLGALPNGVEIETTSVLRGEAEIGKSGIVIPMKISVDNQALCYTIKASIDYDNEAWGHHQANCESKNNGMYSIIAPFYQK